ncbi:MAG: hypothetical protein D3M94_18075 [Rhodocyclales bacterium GT-UBC]|nr:MAG: hypothetical protein D3M94_18075 [Rhodocyclales bacterium GT-UBC]
MPRKRRKKVARPTYLSVGPLPERLMPKYADRLLVFSDASNRRQGGLAVVLFADVFAAPLVAVRSVPLQGSNELELQAALFALAEVVRRFPQRPFTLFSDNHDAVLRLQRAARDGLAQDQPLAAMFLHLGLGRLPDDCDIQWIRAHGTCRGNALADQHAARAAE